MSSGELELTGRELRVGIDPALEFLTGEDGTSLMEETRVLVRGGNYHALAVPSVRFIVDATLGILTQPGVEDRLSREVVNRASIASSIVEYVTSVGCEVNIFKVACLKVLGREADLEWLFDTGNIDLLKLFNEEKVLNSLGRAPFFDVGWVSGGAVRVLRNEGLTGSLSPLIVRSTGLLAISGVHKTNTEGVSEYLGLPYVQKKHLELAGEGENTKIRFTEPVRDFLKRQEVDGRGCPAARVHVPGQPERTVLEEYWSRIVNYLVPPDATAEAKAA
ncbi:MAG TPA: hypothetical protein VLG37_03025 [Candidatus Saccharimonadales bacterium]|nr:hypothetical protein [Candidatus Saccharimonadales bacterium]